MYARLCLLTMFLAIVGCSKPTEATTSAVPAPAPPSTQSQPNGKGEKGKSSTEPTNPIEKKVATTEEQAVEFVTKAGGKVERDENRPGKPVIAVKLSGATL